jgi:hypothetical protein
LCDAKIEVPFIGYEVFKLTAKGEYFQLSYCWHRASFAADRSHRELLTASEWS